MTISSFRGSHTSYFSPMSLLSLPPELLTEISSYIPDRHPTLGYVTNSSDIAAFSSVSRGLRAIARPVLFRSVPITSKVRLDRLKAVMADATDPLELIRELIIVMDVDFVKAFEHFALSYYNDPAPSDPLCPFLCLISILSRTSRIHTLRMRVAHALGTHAFPRRHSSVLDAGLPVGRAIADALRHVEPFDLLSLRGLEVDGFQDMECLLRLAPRLERLRLSMPAGFGMGVNEQLVRALTCVPQLKELSYDPVTLSLPRGAVHYDNDSDVESEGEEDDKDFEDDPAKSSCDLLVALGRILPNLEVLELQPRWFGTVTLFCSSSPLPANVLIRATAYLPNLKRLSLPSSVFSPEQHSCLRLRSLWKVTPSKSLPALFNEALLRKRTEILQLVQSAELDTIKEIAQHAPGIRSVCFLRVAQPHEIREHSISYLVRTSFASPGRHTEDKRRGKLSVRVEDIEVVSPNDLYFHQRRIKHTLRMPTVALPMLPMGIPSPDLRASAISTDQHD
ncbi:uncharacterized protein EI90DRAFT_3022369 [Cantharellus anzutake]|uniref:uncharacterized protein n=1 Tax=Cantharellus anzutake TaxID=1750568 RepID=UPI001907229C|nr:uncharacterized protein EI90DRAFT_3022369 [Cantharellus anzutake]KAF8314369.1 hypothetical protein EI90DRAFT_3022369 [Cantharellus anzutake]